jgi:hypothetical protein
VDVEGIKNHGSPKGEQVPAFEAILTTAAPGDANCSAYAARVQRAAGRVLEVLTVLIADGELVIHASEVPSIYDAAKEASTS